MFNTFASALGMALTVSAAPRLGGCPKDYSPMATFDVNRYAGEWFEISRDKYSFGGPLGGDCVTAKYTANADATVEVYN